MKLEQYNLIIWFTIYQWNFIFGYLNDIYIYIETNNHGSKLIR